MDLAKVLQQLYEELGNLNAAISSLERLEEAAKHRGNHELLGQVAFPVRAVRKRRANSDKESNGPEDSGAQEPEAGQGSRGSSG